MFDFIEANMPQDAPGSLSGTDTAKLVAYILQYNGFKSGTTDLPADSSQLTQVLQQPAQ
jgi:hypothetical protein